MSAKLKNLRSSGFTLIELLIVIAILGILAVVILLALNPVQQLARTRDAGRINAVTQLGHAMEAYATSRNGIYTAESNAWIQSLVDAGEISTIPAEITYSAPATGTRPTPQACGENTTAAGQPGRGFCYDTSATVPGQPNVFIIYAQLESGANNGRCTGTDVAYAVYASSQGRGGIVCEVSTGLNPTGWSFEP